MKLKVYHHNELGRSHQTMMKLLHRDANVLEMGCATGVMTRFLTEEYHCRVTGVELNPEAAAKAEPYAHRLIVGDISDPRVWEQLEGPFDYVTFGDVLEHLPDPWEALRRTRARLGENGYVVASIPNVAYYKIRKQLLLGNFDYTSEGILDDTHLRFFTQKTVNALFRDTGYAIAETLRVFRAKTDRRLWRLYPNAFTYQFVVKAIPVRDASGTSVTGA